MDRRFVYIGAIPQDLDVLKPQSNIMTALGYLASGVLGTNTLVDGLVCTPSVPPDLAIHISAGEIFTLLSVDSTQFGSIAADAVHSIIKQGIMLDSWTGTITPPSTPGQAQNFLVQVQLLEQDVDTTVLPYFNPASLTNPNAVAWSGPSNSGVSQPLTRQQTITISLKPGVAATAGTQVTPTADPGYTGLYAITVAQGQTQITGANIAQVPNAPFIWLKLPQVPRWVQGGTYAWAVDQSATANQIVVTLDPNPTSVTGGFGIRCKVVNANTDAATITINNTDGTTLGPYAVLRSNGAALISGDILANQVVDLVFDGTSFRDITGTNTNTAVGSLTAQSGEGIYVDGTAHVNLAYYNLSPQTPQGPDLFSFYSQSDTHHRVITWANLIAALSGASGLVNIQVITASGTYTKTTGTKKALVFATGGGGSGGVTKLGAGGGGAGATAVGIVDLSSTTTVSCTIGAGGPGVSSNLQIAGQNGGSTSFGTLVVAGGGLGAPPSDLGGVGGTATTGAMLLRGGPGSTNMPAGGNGGASFWGNGGQGCSGLFGTSGAGFSAYVYGAGGGGGLSTAGYVFNDGGLSVGNSIIGTSGAGMSGVIVVLEFA